MLFLLFSTPVLWGQAELKDENRATIFVDLDVEKFRQNPLVKEVGIQSMLSEMSRSLPPIDAQSITRIVFAAECKEFETFWNYDWQSDLPYSFYFLVTFDDPNAVVEMQGPLQDMPSVEFDGKTYHRPPAESNVKNCLIYLNDSQFIFGSEDYVLHGDHQFLTEELQLKLDALPQDRILRAAVDCNSGKDFLQGMLDPEFDFVAPEAYMFVRPFLELDSLALAVDFENTNLLKIDATSPDEESAKKFHSDVSQMLNMGKIGISMLSTNLTTDSQRESFKELVSQLKAEQDGNVVSVDINQPEGFVELVSTLTADLRRQAVRTQRMNKFRQVALSVHNYESALRKFPFVVKDGENASSEISWRARVLPYLEYGGKWDSMDMSQPWDHESNKEMADNVPESFGENGNLTNVVWIKSNVESFAQVTDGSSNTIMLIECPQGIPWLEPGDLSILKTIRMVKQLKDGEELIVAFYDGSVRTIDNTMDHNQLRALLTPAGGEVVDFDE